MAENIPTANDCGIGLMPLLGDACVLPKSVFVIVEDMETDRGGADVVAVYDTEEKADERVKTLTAEYAAGQMRRKYRTNWFVVELVLNQDSRW